jgi:hypothetical protein
MAAQDSIPQQQTSAAAAAVVVRVQWAETHQPVSAVMVVVVEQRE